MSDGFYIKRILQTALPAVVSLAFFGACKMGPNFTPPIVPIPEQYRAQSRINDSTVNLQWWEIFNDTTLYRLVNAALVNNQDVSIAFWRMEQARLSLRSVRSEFYPSLDYQIGAQYGTRTPLGIKSPKAVQGYQVMPSLSWELDIFGRISRSAESAKNTLLASQWGLNAVMLSLVAEVAQSYFELLAWSEALEISRRTYESRRESFLLIESKFRYGMLSELDVQQARIQLAEAASAIPRYRRAKVESYNALCTLIGINPENDLGIEGSILDISPSGPIPTGIPADLLVRRPDLMEAYHNVASQNAMIGVAQAMRLPSIALTGEGGVVSENIGKLFTGESFLWSAAAAITGPVFNFGRNKRRVEIEREKTRQAVLTYRKAVISALEEVENALTQVNTLEKELKNLEDWVDASEKALELSNELYKSGLENYLNVLYANQALFQAELSYVETMQNRLSSYILLYKALGGGWITPYDSLQEFVPGEEFISK